MLPRWPTLHEPISSIGSTDCRAPGRSITLELTDTDFGPQPNAAHVGTVIGGTTYGNVTFRSFFDAANQAFGQGLELTSDTFVRARCPRSPAPVGTAWKRSTRTR